MSAPEKRGRGLAALSAAGVIAATLLGVASNVLVSRFYERWDVTSRGLYTLSDATLETLRSLEDPVDVVVFLSASDPFTVSVRHMLSAYGAETDKLRPRYVDPDRNPAEFLALQRKYGIQAGKTEDGRVVTDASMVVSRGSRNWFVTTDDIVVYDENDGRAKPKLEQALTEGIRNVLERESARICFSVGHQEISIDDGGPSGLAELRYRVQKSNFEVETIDLAAPKLERGLKECQVVVVAGPEVRFSDEAVKRLQQYIKGGGNLFLLANPVLDEENRITPTGLEPLARSAGIELSADFVVERDEKSRLPSGLGESFFAAPKPHGVTRGLLKDGEPRFRVLLSAAQSMKAADGRPVALLSTSQQAFSLRDIRPFVAEGIPPEKSSKDPGGPFVVAFASELPKVGDAPHGPRMIAVGSANPVWGRNFREPTLLGNRLFIESCLSWLAARPSIVSVPEKASHDVGLSLTEESLGDVFRYVLLFMPGAAALLGVFVMLRRRAGEKRSRSEGSDKKSGRAGAKQRAARKEEEPEEASADCQDDEEDAKSDRAEDDSDSKQDSGEDKDEKSSGDPKAPTEDGDDS